MNWKPIFTGADKDAVCVKIKEIAEILAYTKTHDPYLMYGDLGSALFLFHYCFSTEDEKHYEPASRQLLSSVSQVQNSLLYIENPLECKSAFENGLSGVGWGINYLLSHEMIEGDIIDTMGTADTWLFRRMIYDVKSGQYDLMQGAAGIALYCMNRQERFAKEYLNRFVSELSPTIRSYIENTENFAIPTGMSGLFLLLRKMQAKYPEINDLSDITEQLAIVLKRRSFFLPETSSSLPGWNQNEVGILWSHLHIPETYDRALEDALNYGRLHTGTVNENFAAGLYGGNFSLGHLYSRIYQLSGETAFKEMASLFFQKGMEQAAYTEEKTGYKVWLTGINGVYGLHQGLLGGLSGIGLSLLATVTDEEPYWDEALLLS